MEPESNHKTDMSGTLRVVTVGVVVVITLIVLFQPGDHLAKLQTAIGFGLLVLVFLFGFLILLDIASGKIDLSLLLSETSGGASMSRFQLLIFTFVISLSLFLLVAESKKFPDIPPAILTLLGISASTYAVSKGIQASGVPPKQAAPPTPPPPAPVPPPSAPPTMHV